MNRKMMVTLTYCVIAFAAVQGPGLRAMGQENKQEQKVTYTCPMDRDVRNATPGKCPKCGMDLRATAPESQAAGSHAKETPSDAGTQQSVRVPDTAVYDQDGKKLHFYTDLVEGKTVAINFIFTTCTTICPMTSQVFSMLQRKLDDDRSKVHLVSISIDPEQDTPARLRAYAARFRAGASWQHYTGTLQASILAQQAFDVYRGDKANHAPVTLVRAAAGSSWVRFDGFATVDDLLVEARRGLTAAR